MSGTDDSMPADDKPTDCAPGSASTRPAGQGNRPLRERIADAKEQARQSRIAAGLPPDAGPFSDEAVAARAKGRRRRG
jgi:hypothetical protein